MACFLRKQLRTRKLPELEGEAGAKSSAVPRMSCTWPVFRLEGRQSKLFIRASPLSRSIPLDVACSPLVSVAGLEASVGGESLVGAASGGRLCWRERRCCCLRRRELARLALPPCAGSTPWGLSGPTVFIGGAVGCFNRRRLENKELGSRRLLQHSCSMNKLGETCIKANLTPREDIKNCSTRK